MSFCECKTIYKKRINPVIKLYENYCSVCDKYIPLTSPILYESNNVIRENIKSKIYAALNDPTYATMMASCPNCGDVVVTYFTTNDLKRVYVCKICEKYW